MAEKLTDAIAEYQEAIRLGPDVAIQHVNLANALAQISGRMPQAIRIGPSDSAGSLLSGCRSLADAGN